MDLLPTLVSQPQARLALASSLLPAPPHHLPQPGLAAKPPSPMMPAPRLQVGGVSREFKSTISPEDIAYLRQKHEADMTPLERQLLEVYDAQSMTSAGKASRAGAAQSIVSTTSQAVALLRRTGLVSPLTSRQGTVSTSGASLEQEHQAPDTQQQVKHRWTGAYPSTTDASISVTTPTPSRHRSLHQSSTPPDAAAGDVDIQDTDRLARLNQEIQEQIDVQTEHLHGAVEADMRLRELFFEKMSSEGFVHLTGAEARGGMDAQDGAGGEGGVGDSTGDGSFFRFGGV